MLMHVAYRLVAIDTVRYSTGRRLVDPVMSAGGQIALMLYLTRWFQLALRQTDDAGYPWTMRST
jgi:hypothetical protein